MNKTLITFFTVLFCLTSSVGWSLEFKDLVYRDGLYYKKFTEVPFTGQITGLKSGFLQNGKIEGLWISYHNEQLWSKGNYENGKAEGSYLSYHGNGQLEKKGEYKNGKKISTWFYYWYNGELKHKGEYKNGKMDGFWISYHNDGTEWKTYTGFFKDDNKIND